MSYDIQKIKLHFKKCQFHNTFMFSIILYFIEINIAKNLNLYIMICTSESN